MASVTIDDSVQAAWERLTADNLETTWIMLKYPEKSVVAFDKEGSGGFPEFVENLPSDAVAYGAFLVMGVDDRGNTVSRRPKFIFVKWMPDTVPTMQRARAGGHKGAVKEVLKAHIDFDCETADDLTEDGIILKLRQSGGAHAPTGYEFSNYTK
mmetsp:Transcript_7800/g.13141  ORF Transcript_7800/g.13141 Transcript_7800/m.13141 type:complete len:154 (+) Transcript_7800:66-527(+)|eukprot:CAMPEP_0114433710 /NCGR_PEP_ID=MMETSP0103-20121206/11844_1 /TAXON_ID=37642 ORGANISM="Paraphysomonas imperforata, Strain PA2" /NCGR_SAMPLE_ID=MMETSP0103 /ASSEMBLY_ACC=CAM_ASM_000201 /LENGTH=153 /DNA_ID=CAMNT_0001603491 /DNA_START=39 /DNA_END=500 /DNA_ORIENTATION=+